MPFFQTSMSYVGNFQAISSVSFMSICAPYLCSSTQNFFLVVTTRRLSGNVLSSEIYSMVTYACLFF